MWSIALSYGIQIDQIRAWNNIASDSSDIYVGQYLLVRPANLAVASPTLPGEPEAQQKEGSVVSTVSNTVQDNLTPSSPGNTLTVADLAMLPPTGVVTQEDHSGTIQRLAGGIRVADPIPCRGQYPDRVRASANSEKKQKIVKKAGRTSRATRKTISGDSHLPVNCQLLNQ